ncbi:hypothetical protein EVAR_43440_1 [Eumeta japonica]|uniref:Uncharacterized protein n=1 Tax=Eumeta variegata TaxID=151549 RepID=A0A4C1WWS4_EUMVA|nr:hypothetical protein EVAR_43440_1 [Eumeta japonica]
MKVVSVILEQPISSMARGGFTIPQRFSVDNTLFVLLFGSDRAHVPSSREHVKLPVADIADVVIALVTIVLQLQSALGQHKKLEVSARVRRVPVTGSNDDTRPPPAPPGRRRRPPS